LVMHYTGPKPSPKLTSCFRGPFIVISHHKNDVKLRDVLTDAIKLLSSHTLQPFAGTLAEAKEAAMRDKDQFVVKEILSYTGDSTKRTDMVFKVLFMDGDVVDVPYSQDLICEPFDVFCKSKSYLYHLSMDVSIAHNWMVSLRRRDIVDVVPGDLVWVNLRYFGDIWYESLGLPNSESTSYVTRFKYTQWFNRSGSKRKVTCVFLLSGQSYCFDGYLVYAWGSNKILFSDDVVVDKKFVSKYPQVMKG
jgi:hypothetical protein